MVIVNGKSYEICHLSCIMSGVVVFVIFTEEMAMQWDSCIDNTQLLDGQLDNETRILQTVGDERIRRNTMPSVQMNRDVLFRIKEVC